MVELNRKLEHTRRYARAFWQHEMLDRPYVSVTAPLQPSFYSWTPAKSFRACMNEDYDSILVPFAEHIERTYYGGEALPQLELTLGPDQYAGFLGVTIEVSAEAYTTWALPCVEDWADYDVSIDKSENGCYNKLKRYFEYASGFCRDKFLLNMLDLHSNMDALSALHGAQELCLDLFDCPEEVHRVLDSARSTYREIYNMAYEAGQLREVGTIGWSPIYCDGKSAVLQCDFSCLLSPAHGREFVFPAIEEEAESLDHCIYHLDGKDALVHLDTILAIDKIDCVQWVPGEGQPRTLEWMDLLKKIQAAGKSVWLFDWTAEEIKAYHKELQPDKVAFSLSTATPSEADSLLEYLSKNV